VRHPPRVVLPACLVLGCLLSGTASASSLPVPNILDAASPNAEEISKLFWLVMGFSIFVMAIVTAFMIAGIVGGIRDRNHDEEPPQTHGNLKLEIAWTVIPLIILAILLVPTLSAIYQLDGFASPDDAIEVNVVGRQFWWEMTYTDSGVITANELVAPVGTPVKLNLASGDTMHSFWIPQVAGKTDLIPGNQRTLWFTPDREGVFYGQCAEICGDSHANMRLRLVALSPENYRTWLASAQEPARAPQAELAVAGSQLFTQKGCVNCHAVEGVNTYNRVGPDLSHIGSRTSIAAGMLPNTRENMIEWLRYTDTVKPGVAMPNLGLSQEEAESLTAYLETLTLPGFDMQRALDAEKPINQVNEFGYPVDETGAPVADADLAGLEKTELEKTEMEKTQ
jgi:cytochrome c oxidase subunit 2